MKRFLVIAKGIDTANNLDGNISADGTIRWTVCGNKRSSEKSLINRFKSDMNFLHVKVTEIISIEEQ